MILLRRKTFLETREKKIYREVFYRKIKSKLVSSREYCYFLLSLIFLWKYSLIKSIIYLLPDSVFRPNVCCVNCIFGFFDFVFNLSKPGNILFESMPNGNCLFSSASLSLVGDNSLVHGRRVMAAVEQHLNATYYTRHLHWNELMKKANQ